MRRGTQGHVAAPRGPAQHLHGVKYIYIYISYIIRFFVLPYMGRVIPIRTVGSYKPDGFIIIFGVGLKPHLTYLASDVDAR